MNNKERLSGCKEYKHYISKIRLVETKTLSHVSQLHSMTMKYQNLDEDAHIGFYANQVRQVRLKGRINYLLLT